MNDTGTVRKEGGWGGGGYLLMVNVIHFAMQQTSVCQYGVYSF